MNAASLESVMMRLLKYLGIALVLLLPLVLVLGQRPPSVAAVSPPADLISLAGTIEIYGDEPATDDFVTRPLLRSSRRPLIVAEEAVEPVALAAQAEPEPEKLDEAVLKGVFVSGDIQGVIIGAGKERHRILLGEKYKEWALQAVEPRAAVFVVDRAGHARSARIEMEMTTSAPSSSRNFEQERRDRDADLAAESVDEGTSSTNRKESGSVMGRLTFEKMYGEDSPKKGEKE